MRRDAVIEGWQENAGIYLPPRAEAELLRQISDEAFELIKVIVLELSGIRDGDGGWSGTDVIGGLVAGMAQLCNEYDAVKNNPFTVYGRELEEDAEYAADIDFAAPL
jgi:hypothetical protein